MSVPVAALDKDIKHVVKLWLLILPVSQPEIKNFNGIHRIARSKVVGR